jgi:hypothetical protein
LKDFQDQDQLGKETLHRRKLLKKAGNLRAGGRCSEVVPYGQNLNSVSGRLLAWPKTRDEPDYTGFGYRCLLNLFPKHGLTTIGNSLQNNIHLSRDSRNVEGKKLTMVATFYLL